MINIGDKLYYTKDWYEIIISHDNLATPGVIYDKVLKLKTNKPDIHQAVLLDIDIIILERNESNKYDDYPEDQINSSISLLKLIQYYEEERNNRLNSILGKY